MQLLIIDLFIIPKEHGVSIYLKAHEAGLEENILAMSHILGELLVVFLQVLAAIINELLIKCVDQCFIYFEICQEKIDSLNLIQWQRSLQVLSLIDLHK